MNGGSQPSGMVVGVFSEERAASKAVQSLMDAHFDPDQDLLISVARPEGRAEVKVKYKSGVIGGARIGGILGAVAGAVLAALAQRETIPGFAHLLAAKPWIAALQGVLAGASTGYLTGGIAGLGFWSDEIAFGAAPTKDGAIWVEVRASGDRSTEARTIMQGAGATRFES